MKIESVKIERAQIVFSNEELKNMRNACKHLEEAFALAPDQYLKNAMGALEDVMDNIDIEGDGIAFVLDERILEE